jgi:hypothetical protein
MRLCWCVGRGRAVGKVGQEVGSRAVVCSYPQRCDSDTDQHEGVHRETAPPSEGGAAPVEDETAPDPAHLAQVCAMTAFGSELPQHQWE